MLKIIEIGNLEQIYEYQMGFHSPYFFQQNFATWKESFADDVDGEGRVLCCHLIRYIMPHMC